MNYLTPLEQTTAGKQIFGKGVEYGHTQGVAQGVAQGLTRGELIGKIEYAQDFLGHPVSAKEELRAKSLEELSVILQALESESKAFLKMIGRS